MASLLRRRPDFIQIDPTHSLANGLVFAGLGGFAGSAVLNDKSLHGNDGVLTNMDPATDWVWSDELGRWGPYPPDITGSRVIVPYSQSINGEDWGSFTVATWWKPYQFDGTGWWALCLRGAYTDATYGIFGRYTDSATRFYHRGSYNSINTPVSFGALTHLAYTWNNGTIAAYQDGAYIGGGNITGTSSHTKSLGLNSQDNGAYDSAGALFDPLIYNRALSPAEIQSLADPSNVMLDGLITEQYSRAVFPSVQIPETTTTTAVAAPKKSLLRRRPDFVQIDPTHHLADGLVFAGLGGFAGSTVLQDKSLHGNNGTLTNMTPSEDWVFSDELGRWGVAPSSLGDYVSAANIQFSNDREYSLGCWFSRDSGAAALATLISQGTTGSDEFMLRTTATTVQFYAGSGTTPSTTISENTLYHVMVRYMGDSGRCELYLDGVLAATDTNSYSHTTTTNSLQLAGAGSEAGRWFVGDIIDPCIWTRPLSPAEIQSLADPSNVMLDGLIQEQYSRAMFPAGSVPSGGETVTPTVITNTVTVIDPTVTVDATITPSVITNVASVIDPTVTTTSGATVQPTVITNVASVVSPTTTVDATRTPSVISITSTVISPTVSTGEVKSPTVVTNTASVIAPAVLVSSSILPSAITNTTSVIGPAVTLTSTQTPTPIVNTSTVIDPAVAVGPVISPTVISITSTVIDPTVVVSGSVSPTAISIASSVQQPVPAIIELPATIATTTTVNEPTVTAGTDANIPATVISITSSVLNPTILAGQTVTPSVIEIDSTVIQPVSPTPAIVDYYFIGLDGTAWNTPTAWSLSDGGPSAGNYPTAVGRAIFASQSTGECVVTGSEITNGLIIQGEGSLTISGTLSAQSISLTGTNHISGNGLLDVVLTDESTTSISGDIFSSLSNLQYTYGTGHAIPSADYQGVSTVILRDVSGVTASTSAGTGSFNDLTLTKSAGLTTEFNFSLSQIDLYGNLLADCTGGTDTLTGPSSLQVRGASDQFVDLRNITDNSLGAIALNKTGGNTTLYNVSGSISGVAAGNLTLI